MTDPHHIPTARDVMTHSLITLTPEMSIFEAIRKLISNKISGAPVLDSNGEMVGVLSELDCLGILASDQFHADDQVHRVEEEGVRLCSEASDAHDDFQLLEGNVLAQASDLPAAIADRGLERVGDGRRSG